MRRNLFFLFILFTPVFLLGKEIISFEVNHLPPEKPEEGVDISIWIEVLPKDKVDRVYLHYRKIGDEKFRKQRMIKKGDRFYGIISGEVVKEPGFEYFIEAVDIYGEPHNVFFSPSLPKKVLVGAVEEFEFLPALEEEFAIFQEEEIVVAAAKKEQKVSEAPQTVSVLLGEDLRRLPVISLTEAMRLLPGAEVYNVYPSFTVVGIRGFSDEFNNLIVLLLDGREMNVELFGAPLWEQLPVGIEDVERIEVIKGPGGSLYGPNAFSGVVNIVTRGEKYKGFRFYTGAGAYPFTTRTHISYGNKKKSTFYLVSFNHRQSYYFQTSDNDLLNESLLLKIRSDLEKVSLYGDLDLSYGTGTYLEPFSVFREDPFISFHMRFGTEYRFLKCEAWASRTQWTFHPKDEIFLDKKMDEISISNTTADITLEGRWEHPMGILIGGANFRYNYYTVDYMGNANELRVGVFVQDDVSVTKWLRLNLGVRYDYNNQVQPRVIDTLSVRGSFVFPISENHTIRLFGGRAFRKPSFLEYGLSFSPLRATLPISDPDLRDFNEGFISGELSYSGKLKNIKWEVSGYYNLFQNAISYDYKTNRFSNLKFDSDAIGGEVSVEGVIGKNLTLFANYNYQLVRAMDSNEDYGIEAGKRMTNYPEHKINAGLIMRPVRIFMASFTFSFVSSRYFPVFRDPDKRLDAPDAGGTPVKPYSLSPIYLLNFKIALLLSKERLELGVIGYNMLNRQDRIYPGEELADYTFGGESQPLRIMGYIQGYF